MNAFFIHVDIIDTLMNMKTKRLSDEIDQLIEAMMR